MSTIFKESLTRELARLIDDLPDEAVPRADPRRAAQLMMAALPCRSPYDDLIGPFYDTTGLRTLLGISRQAIDQRSRRGAVLRVITSDHQALYPVFQFNGAEVCPGVRELLAEFTTLHDPDGWLRATWFATPAQVLGQHTPRDVCTDPGLWETYRVAAAQLAREAAQRWSEAP